MNNILVEIIIFVTLVFIATLAASLVAGLVFDKMPNDVVIIDRQSGAYNILDSRCRANETAAGNLVHVYCN